MLKKRQHGLLKKLENKQNEEHALKRQLALFFDSYTVLSRGGFFDKA
jgi:hypothetical protein